MLTLFVSALIMGFVFNAAPGAVFAETLKRGFQSGYGSALQVQVGSLVGDAFWAILGLTGVNALFQIQYMSAAVALLGALYLFWLGLASWRDAQYCTTTALDADHAAAQNASALWSGVFLSLTNPQNITYWAALGAAVGSLGIEHPDSRHFMVFFLGFITASVVWCFMCAGLVQKLSKNLGDQWRKITFKVCALSFFLLAGVTASRFLLNARSVWF